MMIEKKSRTCKLRSSKTANKTFWIYKKVVWDKKVKRSFFFSKKMARHSGANPMSKKKSNTKFITFPRFY